VDAFDDRLQGDFVEGRQLGDDIVEPHPTAVQSCRQSRTQGRKIVLSLDREVP
jgi:hypothetical protein